MTGCQGTNKIVEKVIIKWILKREMNRSPGTSNNDINQELMVWENHWGQNKCVL